MFHVVLYEPEIPPNTGNIIRLCANTGSQLHLIHPLGFDPDDKQLRRAGLDYHDWVQVQQHLDWRVCLTQLAGRRVFAFSTKGKNYYQHMAYQPGDVLLFGPETRGLPAEVMAGAAVDAVLRIPMVPNNRSLNLSNAVAVVLFEAWRQNNFAGSE